MIRCTGCKKFQTMQQRLFFARLDMNMFNHCSRHFTGCQKKERIILKIATFVFRFFDGILPPYLSSCLSVNTPSHTLFSSSDVKKLSCLRGKLKGFGYRSFSLRLPCLEPPSCSHPTWQFSQFKMFLKDFLYRKEGNCILTHSQHRWLYQGHVTWRE